jgi:glycine cleavage system transcriptional repressor
MTSSSQHKLVISAITQDRPGIVNKISQFVTDAQCNIEDSRMMVLGGSFAILMMVSGSEAAIKKLQNQEPALSKALGSSVQMQITADRAVNEQARPYYIEVVALDHQGIVRELSEFVASRNINIESMNTETYAAPHTGSTMFRLEMIVNIPVAIRMSEFRNSLADFCDQKNLDMQIEPYTV